MFRGGVWELTADGFFSKLSKGLTARKDVMRRAPANDAERAYRRRVEKRRAKKGYR